MLPPTDRAYLESKSYRFDEVADGGLLCVVIHNYKLPSGYVPEQTDLLLRLPQGFPDVPPDMWWCDPPVRLAATSAFPQNADLMETHLGRNWQRFSRHFQPGAWHPGRDSLQSYLQLINRNLANSLPS